MIDQYIIIYIYCMYVYTVRYICLLYKTVAHATHTAPLWLFRHSLVALQVSLSLYPHLPSNHFLLFPISGASSSSIRGWKLILYRSHASFVSPLFVSCCCCKPLLRHPFLWQWLPDRQQLPALGHASPSSNWSCSVCCLLKTLLEAITNVCLIHQESPRLERFGFPVPGLFIGR